MNLSVGCGSPNPNLSQNITHEIITSMAILTQQSQGSFWIWAGMVSHNQALSLTMAALSLAWSCITKQTGHSRDSVQAGVCQSSWGKRPGSQAVSIFFSPDLFHKKAMYAHASWRDSGFPTAFFLAHWFSNELRRLNLQCQTPGLSCPICDLNSSLPKETLYFYNPTPFCDPFQGNRLPSACFPSLPTQLCVDLSYSLVCMAVFLPVSRWFSVRMTPHVNVFLMYLSGQVCSVNSDEFSVLLLNDLNLFLQM